MPRVVASATSAPFACAARVAGAHRAGVRMLQPMGHLRLFLPMALGKAGAVRRPPPSGHAGIGPQGDSLRLPGCIIRYVRRVYVPRLARVL